MTAAGHGTSGGSPAVTLDVIAALFPAGGIGRYVRDLAGALLTEPAAPRSCFAYPDGLPGLRIPRGWEQADLRVLPWGQRRHRLLTVLSARTGVAADRWYGWPDAVHLPAGYGPTFRRAPMLVTVHDHTAITHPEWHPTRTRLLIEASAPVVLQRARKVVCDSEHVRRQTLELFPLDPGRVETVHLPVGAAFRPVPRDAARAVVRRLGLEEPFVLHVGTFEPRKNHVGVARAFDRLRSAGFPGLLVMVGQDGWRVGPIHAGLAACRERAAHRVVRDASDHDLAALYSACELFVYPSLDEGFGFPPLEALACGAAVIVSNRASLPEVVGDAALMVEPGDEDALAGALIGLWRDPARAEALRSAGPARAALFDRGVWVRRMLQVYRELLSAAG